MSRVPNRIVCLSAEAADWLWRIGAWHRVAGVTAWFRQPEDVPSKPRVSGFSSANLDEIARSNPDLIITFSDVQARLAAELVQRGFAVLATNQRTLAETEETMALLARIVDCERAGETLLREFGRRLEAQATVSRRPRVYFEEWDDPFISGIAWVVELIERAGGDDIFADLRNRRAAKDRVVSTDGICRADPEIILASWCGKPVQSSEIVLRPGWEKVTAVRQNRIHEIPGEDILQPGFRLVYGYETMKQLLARK